MTKRSKNSRPASQETTAIAESQATTGVDTPNTGGADRIDWVANLDNPKQREFILAYRQVGILERVAEITGTPTTTHRNWMARCPNYRVAFKTCRDSNCDLIEESLVERLAFGWDEPVFYEGSKCGKKRKYDNSGAMAYLDRHDPEFRKHKASSPGTQVNIQNNDNRRSVIILPAKDGVIEGVHEVIDGDAERTD